MGKVTNNSPAYKRVEPLICGFNFMCLNAFSGQFLCTSSTMAQIFFENTYNVQKYRSLKSFRKALNEALEVFLKLI